MAYVDSRLDEAEGLLRKDIDQELDARLNSVEPPLMNPGKYEQAKEMFAN